jgi:hypothetical protein
VILGKQTIHKRINYEIEKKFYHNSIALSSTFINTQSFTSLLINSALEEGPLKQTQRSCVLETAGHLSKHRPVTKDTTVEP